MKKEILAVFTMAVLLAGCDTDEKNEGSGGGLVFDVGGHWDMFMEGGSGYVHFADVVVDPDGRFMGTQGDPDVTMIGMQEGSIELDGSGVSAFGAYCSPGSSTTFDCGTMDFTLAITDDDTMEGELEVTEFGQEEIVKVKWVRLTELNKAIADADMIGTWESASLQTSVMNIDSTGAFSLAYSGNASATGTTTKIADNIYGIDATVFLESGQTPASGLAFVDESGRLNVGVIADVSNLTILGDIYQKD